MPESRAAVHQSLRVLIIDDEPVDREIFKHYLDGDLPGAFSFAEAGRGQDGLREMERFKPDCVLLDFNLPDVDGLKMVRHLQQGRDFLPCAVVMLTGIGSEKIAVEAMKLGVMDYMAKNTASAQALSMTVASAVQRFRLQQEVAQQRLALEQRNRELEATRAELFEEKERYRILTEAIPQLVWTADSDGCIHYGNQHLWDFKGKPSDRTFRLESLVHAGDRIRLREKWTEAVRSNGAFESELRLWRAQDQTWRWHLMRTAPIRATDGGPVRWFGTFTDIEEQKQAEEAVRQREKLDSIAALAGGIAHDFNNLLVGIMGGTSFALDSLEQGHSAYPMLEIILRSSERAAHLTQQLLAYAGKMQVFLEPVDIPRAAREACDSLRNSIPGNVHLVISTLNEIPRTVANAAQVRQVIINLVMNAAEAIGEEQGVVTVRTTMEAVAQGKPQTNVLGYELPAGPYIMIEVSDSGRGMADEIQKQIFDPFFTSKFTGRGLGLAAVQGIVRVLGGGIRLTSAIGRGSTFQILLPLKQPGEEAAMPNTTQPGAASNGIEDARAIR